MTDATPVRGPKFRRRAAARPDEVLDAALDLFIERGFAATKVDDIGKRAGISKGAVYLYFPSKDAIIEALIQRAVQPVRSEVLAGFASFEGDPRIIISIVLRRLGQDLSHPRLLAIPRLIMREVVNFPGLGELYRREVLDQVMPVLTGLLARGIAAGYLRPVDPELTIRSLMGPIMIHIMLGEIFGITPEGGLALDRLIENHLSILFDGLSTTGARP